ncbi:MAG: type III-A CRISPR-associated RAMP protein Csm5, partial [Deltaproteobacteria bacterium]|nr:type III-A CRISPR-associated RAMP protein Csm5 [Deltaproteobacteria bacterium]
MRYSIKILSPLHIGCGQISSGLNHINNDGKLFFIEPDDFISDLGKKERMAFIEWIEECSGNLDRIENQKIELKYARDAPSYNEKKNLNEELKTQKKKFTLNKFAEGHNIDLSQIANKARYCLTIKRGVYADSEINTFIKQMNHPYIPGTEIKGAIRTAVLYCSLNYNDEIKQWIKGKIKEFG